MRHYPHLTLRQELDYRAEDAVVQRAIRWADGIVRWSNPDRSSRAPWWLREAVFRVVHCVCAIQSDLAVRAWRSQGR